MQTKRFTHINTGFKCENCGHEVPQETGSRCRNHCDECLYSKHVDVNPGDRSANCGGLMKPIEITSKHGEMRILHQCMKCGYKRYNRASEEDKLAEFYETQN